MRRLLQTESHEDVPYDRPNLPWVCGLAAEGCPCRLGPTPRGKCPDERCRPQRSLRVRRGRLARGAALFVFGAAAMFIGSSWRYEALAPGPLAQAHAQLLSGGRATNRCAACHPGGPDSVLGIAPVDKDHATQSQLCVECHKSLIDPELALAAHSIDPGALESSRAGKTADAPPPRLASLESLTRFASRVSSGDAPGEVACAACHQEHHGAGHDLRAITDARCQACHQQRFASFAADHPDFGAWPFRRRTRINFDHNTHASKHFKEKNEAFACAACHLDGPGGDAKVLAGYEASCAKCHDEGIRSSLGEGLAVVSLPTVDREAITRAGGRLGPWPAAAIGDFDGELSAITTLLLAADPEARPVIDFFGPGFTFFNLDPQSADDSIDALVLAYELRELVIALGERGHAEVLSRVAKLTDAAPEPDLAGAMPVTAVDEIRRTWFAAGDAPRDAPPAIELAGRQAGGGWFVDDRGLALRYLPRGHADPMLRAWIDLAASLGDEHQKLRESALSELAGAATTGQCAKCHSIDQTPTGLMVNWRGLDASRLPRGFTRFSHRPHVLQPELADCSHCHALDPDAGAIPAPYASRRPTELIAQFEPMAKDACVSCHQPKAAGEGCTQCHNYHVDRHFPGLSTSQDPPASGAGR